MLVYRKHSAELHPPKRPNFPAESDRTVISSDNPEDLSNTMPGPSQSGLVINYTQLPDLSGKTLSYLEYDNPL